MNVIIVFASTYTLIASTYTFFMSIGALCFAELGTVGRLSIYRRISYLLDIVSSN